MSVYEIKRKIRMWIRTARLKLALWIGGDDYNFLVVPNELPEKCIKRIAISETMTREMYRSMDAGEIKERLIKSAYSIIADQTACVVRRAGNGVRCDMELFLLKRGDDDE